MKGIRKHLFLLPPVFALGETFLSWSLQFYPFDLLSHVLLSVHKTQGQIFVFIMDIAYQLPSLTL